MNRQQLTDKLLHNWPAKVICFTIAIFLYLFYQSSLIDKKTFVVPLEVKENGIVVHVGNIPSSVVVSVRTNEADIKTIFASDMAASIDLNNIVESGSYTLPVQVVISDKLKGLDPLEVKLKEEKLKIDVERKVARFVKVVPAVVGDVAPDYEIKSIEMNPSTVQIVGPESLVNSISEISTGRVNVSNAMTNFTTETSYNQISNFIEIVDKAPCKATVVVAPKISEFIIENVPIRFINLDDDLAISDDIPNFIIKLKGELPTFKKFNITKNPIRIDLSEIEKPGVYELPVKFNLPKEFELIEKSGDTITITIVEKKNLKIDSNNFVSTMG